MEEGFDKKAMLEKRIDKKEMRENWSKSSGEWREWIEKYIPHLMGEKDYDGVKEEEQRSVDVLARALEVGGHCTGKI
jgi:hypothetical protein